METKDIKVICFYDPDGILYAFSENRNFVFLFENTRRLHNFKKKKLRMNEIEYRAFLSRHRLKLLMMNVLTDGVHSFDYITTYQENSDLEHRCEEIYDRIMELERELVVFPFNESIQNKLQILFKKRQYTADHEDKSSFASFGYFNTFEIFVRMFKDSIF